MNAIENTACSSICSTLAAMPAGMEAVVRTSVQAVLDAELLFAAPVHELDVAVLACGAIGSEVHVGAGAPAALALGRKGTPERASSAGVTLRCAQSASAEWSEIELLQRMIGRESRAWREFHQRYDRLIYRAIHKVTQRFSSVLSSSDVEEIYALLLCSLNGRDMHKLRTFEPERGHRLSTWVGLLATNAAWDYLRSLSRQPQRGNAVEAEDVSCANPDPFHALAAKEEWDRVRDMLSSFSEKDRMFVDLFFLQGRTPEQIAEEMQISVKTVYSKKHKIRCRLEHALGRPSAAAA